MNNSIKLKRRLTQTLTYLYLIGLSIVIIYPLLITIMSAFKAGNVVAFKLDSNVNFSLDNFKGLFTETLYGTWYLNTLIIALITMVVQTSIIVLAGYAYSRYNFLARKQSLVFFLIIQMVPTMAALTAFFVMALMLNALNHSWFLIFLYVGGGAGSTDILISWIYRLTTGPAPQYSMAAAVTLIISIIVISISMIAFKKLHAFDMEDV